VGEPSPEPNGTLDFGTIVVVGGGCYGSQYVRQLRRARAAGKVRWHRVVVVDHRAACAFAAACRAHPTGDLDLSGAADHWDRIDLVVEEWTAFFAHWLGAALRARSAHASDAIVPSPLMPHLLFEWLVGAARAASPDQPLQIAAPGEIAGIPWQQAGTDGTRYVSYATWTCPINCIEPAKCPHTKGPRDWSMHGTLPSAGPATATALLRVTHRAFGVGMIDVADVLAAHTIVTSAAARRLPAWVATASHCHGAVGGIVPG
jgi:hypothetical protein